MNCPICARQTDAEYTPFCSKRCADVDLARWLTGRYVIPSAAADDESASDMERGPKAAPLRRQ
jgi:endogenous inhibitor of DNA gyrase (YacG/DUF329 family)